MSWDGFLMKGDANWKDYEDIPPDYELPTIGTYEEVLAKIKRMFPHVDDQEKGRIVVENNDYAMILSTGIGNINFCMVHIYGDGEAIHHLLEIAKLLNVTAWDISSGTALGGENAAYAFGTWQVYRNRVMENALTRDNASEKQFSN